MSDFEKNIKLCEKSLSNIRGIFDGNKIKDKISRLNKEVLKKDFWKDQNNSKKYLKKKIFRKYF